ncbi:hypothetical protein AcW1_007131 [Taiwanofungus camphoratus]|nr:hypothetical protein AcW1_007131 [Antrodia cinnamomea]
MRRKCPTRRRARRVVDAGVPSRREEVRVVKDARLVRKRELERRCKNVGDAGGVVVRNIDEKAAWRNVIRLRMTLPLSNKTYGKASSVLFAPSQPKKTCRAFNPN